jgi:hypothetical protein
MEKIVMDIKYVFYFQIFSISIWRIMLEFCEETNVNIQLFLSDLNSTRDVSTDFIKAITTFHEDPFS